MSGLIEATKEFILKTNHTALLLPMASIPVIGIVALRIKQNDVVNKLTHIRYQFQSKKLYREHLRLSRIAITGLVVQTVIVVAAAFFAGLGAASLLFAVPGALLFIHDINDLLVNSRNLNRLEAGSVFFPPPPL